MQYQAEEPSAVQEKSTGDSVEHYTVASTEIGNEVMKTQKYRKLN